MLGVEVDIFPYDGIRPWRQLLYFPGVSSLRELADSISSYDLIHIHGLWYAASTLAAWVARSRGKPYIVTPHGMLDQWALKHGWAKKKIYYWLAERRNLRCAASVHLLNAGEYEASRAALDGIHPFILPNGVDVSAYEDLPEKADLTSIYPRLEGKIVVLFLGRINYKKGLDILIGAFQRARTVNQNLHLLIAGPDAGYLSRLGELITENGIGDHVTLVGMVSDHQKCQLLSAADMFVLTSYQEGDSMALKEAMAAALPTIISTACNFPDAEENDCGVIVPYDTRAISEAILSLANDRQRREAMGERAKRLMRARFTWTAITAKLMVHYREILRQREN